MTTQTSLPRVGEPAPDFRLPSTEGRDLGLEDFQGRQPVVLYFYPRDDTPGCAAEACAFRDLLSKFEERGVQILGVSTDSIRSHKKFKDKYGLPFPLLSDPNHQVAERYGVWQQKRFMGREYVGVARTTFVIDEQGTLKAVFPNVKVQGHADEVLAALGT